ncbi:hypothetical protein [Bifidobacterium sp. SO1]|uniref:hypothetical protein n=1 Tax=Bifidobacterium sp. SO1 TaxID=2809029 RepID=UPI001BDBD800|nr:hypothetical protein [Bifidobacterium sp. SO1]MBT1161742.1 hypothetical protein [Bifidobacterium sp. SO1]
MAWIEQATIWYNTQSVFIQGAITLIIGILAAIIIFKIALAVLKTVIRAVIAAILAFLLTTIPGNMLLAHAYDTIDRTIDSSINM